MLYVPEDLLDAGTQIRTFIGETFLVVESAGASVRILSVCVPADAHVALVRGLWRPMMASARSRETLPLRCGTREGPI
jgi:hypothetical protein